MPHEPVVPAGGLPTVAALSPAAVAGLVWLTAQDSGGGIEGLSRVLQSSLAVVAVALGLSVVALVRSRDRVERVLSIVGLVGNGLLLTWFLLGPPR